MLTTRTGSPARTSRSAERALTILLVLAEARQPMSFADLQRSLGWPKGSLHALLKTLESQRFVLLDVDKGKYTVGIAAFEVGAAYPAPTDLSDTPQRRYWRNWSEPSTKHATWRCSTAVRSSILTASNRRRKSDSSLLLAADCRPTPRASAKLSWPS